MKRRAFTLIELLVVISIIGLLSSIVLASLNSARDKGRIGAGKQFEATMYHAEADFAAGIWDFDECSGTAKDRSGNGNDTTFAGSPAWSTLTVQSTGCSLLFNGSNYVKTIPLTTGSPLNIPGDVTLSAWIYPTSNTGLSSVIRGGQFYDEQYSLQYDVNGSLRFQWSNGTSFFAISSSQNVVSMNRWAYIAAVRSGTTVYFYVNGTFVGSGTVSAPTTTAPAYLEIGMYGNGSGGGFIGNIDNVRVYAKSLTALDIGALYAMSSSRYGLATIPK